LALATRAVPDLPVQDCVILQGLAQPAGAVQNPKFLFLGGEDRGRLFPMAAEESRQVFGLKSGLPARKIAVTAV